MTQRAPRARRGTLVVIGMALTLALLLGLYPAHRTLAHAELARSVPAANASLPEAPTSVQLWFTEEVDPSFTTAYVLDRNGQRVDTGTSRVLSEDRRSLVVALRDLSRGTYTVTWKALSLVDGHITRGGFAFAVGEAVSATASPQTASAAVPNPLSVAVRWLSLAGALVTVGGFLFLAGVWLPAAPRLRTDREGQRLLADALPRLRGLLGLGLAGLVLGSVGLLLIQVADLAEGSLAALGPALAQFLFGTRLGLVWLARLALLAALAALLVQARRTESGRCLRPLAWAGISLGALLLLTFSVMGHGGATGAHPWVNVTVDWGHLLAAAAWIGALVHLGGLLPLLLRLADRPRRAAVVAVLSRFSTVALTASGVLLATGLYSAVLHIPDLLALFDTRYGNAVLGKALAFLLLGALGGINLVLLVPRLGAEGRGTPAGASRTTRLFRGVVLAEIVLGILVLVPTAVVTSVTPARQAVALPGARGWQGEQQAEDLRVGLRVTPFEAGVNHLAVMLQDRRGRPVEAERVTLRLTMLDHDMGVQEVPTAATAPGSYAAQGSFLSMVGNWQAEVLVRRAGFDDARAVFPLPVPNLAPGKQAAQAAPGLGAIGNPSLLPLLALELVALGLLLALISWRRGGAVHRADVLTLGGAAAAFLAAGVVGAVAQLTPGSAGPAAASTVGNPYPADERSLTIGAQVYRQHCLACHGAQGRGDGPAAAGLRPRPADFAVHLRAGHTEADLFDWISNGVPGTAMPAFGDRLSEEERWHVLNYLRSLVTPADR
ncbi:MAG: copper resistance protein CopC [Chloroflexi bacterium]|nr:copper resistance protein CopC [Chloroflexota bacterium]